jgi:hypothetical protein
LSNRTELMLARSLNRPSAAGGGRLLIAGKNRPADGFDGQVSVTEQPFEWQWRLSGAKRSAAFGTSPVADDPKPKLNSLNLVPQSCRWLSVLNGWRPRAAE